MDADLTRGCYGPRTARVRLPIHVTDTTDFPSIADDPASTAPAVRQDRIDHGALWRQVEAETARVVLLDLERCAILSGRMMNAARDRRAFVVPDSPLDRLFPRADAMVRRWAEQLPPEPGPLQVHKLSPRHWAYFWRLGPKVAMLAIVRHRYGRGAVAAGDAAAIQLLCEHWLAPDLHAMAEARMELKRAQRADTRTRAAARRELRAGLGVTALVVACGGWLVAGGASAPPPDPHAPTLGEQQRLARLSDESLQRSLARALAAHDAVAVQLALDDHLGLGHFPAAVVLDASAQVVARSGLQAAADPGQPLSAAASAALGTGVRSIALRQAGTPVGRLLMAPPAAAPAPAAASAVGEAWPDAAKRGAGAVLALVGLLAGLRLWRHLAALKG